MNPRTIANSLAMLISTSLGSASVVEDGAWIAFSADERVKFIVTGEGEAVTLTFIAHRPGALEEREFSDREAALDWATDLLSSLL